ncbi:glycosyltransferase [Leptolyngbyaceae cyanobacterium CCMR0082]|uniref:Glycosyltransferase n=1 Tax=Adonisia turfae CCMR0082 TaxID=2304604 RepID=A0A6M0SC89_9CYAN|nr:glycosyltransferase [Adonisia turfae]NEZ66094.1 glycosyltransferase [Adonisia turfae CCMR0082]
MTATLLSPPTVTALQPSVTIVVAPRERFGYTQKSLESIYQHTKIPFELIYVDAGSPKHIQKYLAREAAKRGFTLLRSDQFLSPNQARNLGLSQITTDYVVFIDNDIHVSSGWLEPLLRCAKETNAAAVCPLTCIGKPLHDRIHFAGGEARIFMDVQGEQIWRRLYEKRFLVSRSAAAIKHQLYRRACELVELRCTLVRRDIFEQLGCLDEKLLGTQEDIDFCLSVSRAHGQMFCEPASVVTHVPEISYRWSDLGYFMLRWSDMWEVESLMYFQQKWALDMDEYFLQRYRQLGQRRHQTFLYPLLHRLQGNRKVSWLENIVIKLEQWLNQILADRHAKLRHTPIKKLTPTSPSPNHKTVPHKKLHRSVIDSHSHPTQLSQPHLMPH